MLPMVDIFVLAQYCTSCRTFSMTSALMRIATLVGVGAVQCVPLICWEPRQATMRLLAVTATTSVALLATRMVLPVVLYGCMAAATPVWLTRYMHWQRRRWLQGLPIFHTSGARPVQLRRLRLAAGLYTSRAAASNRPIRCRRRWRLRALRRLCGRTRGSLASRRGISCADCSRLPVPSRRRRVQSNGPSRWRRFPAPRRGVVWAAHLALSQPASVTPGEFQ